MAELVKEHERVDDLYRCGYRMIQDPARFCFGMDAVLLADFARAYSGEAVMDLGTGTGIIPTLMAARCPGTSYVGLELQEEMAEMAARSAALNGLEDRLQIRQGDIRRVREQFAAGAFRAVTANPPYMKVRGGLQNREDALSIARHETHCSLRDVMEAAAYLLNSRGRLYLVHRPLRLPEIFSEMKRVHLEPKRLRMVHPYRDQEPAQVLIEGVLQGGPELRVMPPLIVYERPGVYTKELLRIYGMETAEQEEKQDDQYSSL